MRFKQFYLGCLSHASYYIGSEGEAAVIDPQRDIDQYLAEAEANAETIKYVIETHSHADFVSGHAELAARTGAEIVYGQRAETQFPTLKVSDGDTLAVGRVKLTFLETPGHTPEGITIVAEDTEPSDVIAPLKMFTGDTLFVGDVGRPDLVGSKGFTSEEMAAMLYDSLHNTILAYPDDTEIYPAHGAGSLCGRSLSKETWSTLGEQRKFNYALQPMPLEDFVSLVAADQPEVPIYFPQSAARNLEGAPALSDISQPVRLSSAEIDAFDGVVIDVRRPDEYGAGHVRNSVNIGLGGQFATWAGSLVPIGTPLAIVAATEDQVAEAAMRLARVGHETVRGYTLSGEYAGDKAEVEQVSVEVTAEITKANANVQFVDVRRVPEHNAGHAPRTKSIPLDKLATRLDELDPTLETYVICQGGYRSSIGTGILENAGFEKVYNVTGGTGAWIAAGLLTEEAAATNAAA